MSKPRSIALSSLFGLLAGITLLTGVLTVANSVSEGQSVAGIEREGDIPLPIAHG